MKEFPIGSTESAFGGSKAGGATAPVGPVAPGLDAWRAFLVAHALVTRRLDDELRTEAGISLAEYDALVQLANAEDGTLRMSQLAERVLLSRSGVTRLVDRLEAAGHVERRLCESDARGSFACLTPAGASVVRAAAGIHARGIERHFLAALSASELEAIRSALDTVARRIAAPGEVAACDAHAVATGAAPSTVRARA